MIAQPMRAATDDALTSSSSTGPVRRKRRHTDQGLFRGGTKSVPESANVSEDEESSDEDDGPAPFLRDVAGGIGGMSGTPHTTADEMVMSPDGETKEVEMQTLDALNDTLVNPDFTPGSSLSEVTDSSQTWSSGVDTPVHSSAWSTVTNAALLMSSHLSVNSSHHNIFYLYEFVYAMAAVKDMCELLLINC